MYWLAWPHYSLLACLYRLVSTDKSVITNLYWLVGTDWLILPSSYWLVHTDWLLLNTLSVLSSIYRLVLTDLSQRLVYWDWYVQTICTHCYAHLYIVSVIHKQNIMYRVVCFNLYIHIAIMKLVYTLVN